MFDDEWRNPNHPGHPSWLCQVRVGLVEALRDIDDDKTMWSLLEAIEMVDDAIDSSAATSDDPAVEEYITIRREHFPSRLRIPQSPNDWPL